MPFYVTQIILQGLLHGLLAGVEDEAEVIYGQQLLGIDLNLHGVVDAMIMDLLV